MHFNCDVLCKMNVQISTSFFNTITLFRNAEIHSDSIPRHLENYSLHEPYFDINKIFELCMHFF